MKKILSVLTISVSTLISSQAMAIDANISAIKIDGLFQKDSHGLYDQVFSAVQTQSSLKMKLNVTAPKKAFSDFEKGKVACISPANTNPDFYNYSFETISSKVMTPAQIFIFSKAGSTPYADLASISGKKIGVRTGMPYGHKVENANLKLVQAKTIEANIKKLNNGRIDAFLAYTPDIDSAFNDLGMDPLPRSGLITQHDDTLLCRKDMNGEAIITEFNKGFQAIDASGELSKIFE